MTRRIRPETQRTLKASVVLRKLRALGDANRARLLQRFFKTGPGEYGEGDVFLGLRVRQVRALARECQALALSETIRLLHSRFHEARLLALIILVQQFKRGDDSLRKEIFNAYVQNTRFINSWDLVDVSAGQIVGPYLANRSRKLLHTQAKSSLLWERRISIIATSHYISRGEFTDTLRIARKLLHDPEDLIHKAVGWMLREIGKRDRAAEEGFLKAHCRTMPRTMLRYAIEKFPEKLRRRYLAGTV